MILYISLSFQIMDVIPCFFWYAFGREQRKEYSFGGWLSTIGLILVSALMCFLWAYCFRRFSMSRLPLSTFHICYNYITVDKQSLTILMIDDLNETCFLFVLTFPYYKMDQSLDSFSAYEKVSAGKFPKKFKTKQQKSAKQMIVWFVRVIIKREGSVGVYNLNLLIVLQHMHSNFGENALSNYTNREIIGKGAYGYVFRCIDSKNREVVAMKKVILDMENEGFPSTSIRQISLLREIDHKNVVTLKDVVIDQKQLYLIFQYLDKDLRTYMDGLGTRTMEPIKVKKFLYQMLAGIADCHMKRIIHRDLKPANILLDNNDNLKIADFGLARTFSIPVRPYSEQVVTLWYRAPEILLGSMDYCTPIDIWAIGCIFAEMVTKRPLFAGDSELDQLYRIFRILGTPSEETWPGVTKLRDYKSTFPNWPSNPIQHVVSGLSLDALGLDLLNRMLKYDPNTRITAKAALSHPYFREIFQ